MPLLDILGIKYPIIQGPFGGGFSTIKLTSTVSNMGGMGSFGAHQLNSKEIESLCKKLRQETEKPFAINLWVSNRDKTMDNIGPRVFETHRQQHQELYKKLNASPPEWHDKQTISFENQVEGILRAKPKVFSFVFGIPSPEILSECKKQGIITLAAATTVEEAIKAESSGVDIILATGFEAGGHRPSFLKAPEDSLYGTLTLVPAICEAVSTPVVAGGGIANRRSVKAALELGAEAVQIGTAFLACQESGAPEIHKKLLKNNKGGLTTLSKAYSGRLARFIPNALTEHYNTSATLPFPAQGWLTDPIKSAATINNNTNYMPIYAGQGTPLIHHSSAKNLMTDLIKAL